MNERELFERWRMEAEQARILVDQLDLAIAEGRHVTLRRPTPDSGHLALHMAINRDSYARIGERNKARQSRKSANRRGGGRDSKLRPAAILNKSDGCCYLCQADLRETTFEIDHVIPIAHGGKHVDENLLAACKVCNSRKSDRFVAFDVTTRRPFYFASRP